VHEKAPSVSKQATITITIAKQMEEDEVENIENVGTHRRTPGTRGHENALNQGNNALSPPDFIK
jgi:hypothetical protein